MNILKTVWLEGSPIELYNIEHILLALDWLKEYQKCSRGKIMDKFDANFDLDGCKNLDKKLFSEKQDIMFAVWRYDYYNLIIHNKIPKSSVHGDFWIGNILIDNNNKIGVIDWENYRQIGNPFTDYMQLILNQQIKTNFKFTYEIENKVSDNFGFKIELKTLLRWEILRRFSHNEARLKSKGYKKLLKRLME